MSISHRINHQPIFLLSSKPWRENSLWVEVFSRDYGRVALLARSARTRGSELRGILVPFVPICASWYGKEELKTLHRCEWIGGWAQPQSLALFSALYANELVLKLTARDDSHPDIYQSLYRLMQIICTQEQHTSALRQFEYQLLHALGIAPDFSYDDEQRPIVAQNTYCVYPEDGVRRVDVGFAQPQNGVITSGLVLQQIQQGQFTDIHHAKLANKIMRLLIDFRLPKMQTRLVLQQLNQMKKQQLLL